MVLLSLNGWTAVQIAALGAALFGALLLNWTERRWPDVQEAVIGVTFILAANAAILLLAALAAGPPAGFIAAGATATSEPASTVQTPDDALRAEGERWWTRSPDPRNPVACATCHHDPALTRGWAAGFPKVKPLPPPHTRVMTLLQANAEAVARHVDRGSEPVVVVVDIDEGPALGGGEHRAGGPDPDVVEAVTDVGPAESVHPIGDGLRGAHDNPVSRTVMLSRPGGRPRPGGAVPGTTLGTPW